MRSDSIKFKLSPTRYSNDRHKLMDSDVAIVRYLHPIEYGKFPVSFLIRFVQFAFGNKVSVAITHYHRL